MRLAGRVWRPGGRWGWGCSCGEKSGKLGRGRGEGPCQTGDVGKPIVLTSNESEEDEDIMDAYDGESNDRDSRYKKRGSSGNERIDT